MFRVFRMCLVASVAVVGWTACGSDIPTGGATLNATGGDASADGSGNLGGQDATAGSDGSVGPQDVNIVGEDGIILINPDAGATVDGTIGVDSVTPIADATQPAGSCVGKCGDYKKSWPCQCDKQCVNSKDCCSDFAAVCGTSPGPVCGNAKCEAGESENSCPQDCNATQLLSCVAKQCPDAYAACKNDPLCGKVLTCAENCKDSACQEKCAEGVDQKSIEKYLVPLGQCAQQKGCVQPDPPPMYCGDGQCTGGETSQNCPQDCGVGPDPSTVLACLGKACKNQLANCQGSKPCQQVLDCAANCADINCLYGCAQLADPKTQQSLVLPLGECGQNNGCFSGTQPTTVCGNGKCESGETSKSCPQDCKGPPPVNPVEQCLADKCAKTWTTCSASAECYAAAQCLQKGGSLLQCVKSWQVGQLLQPVVQCAQQNGCLEGTTPEPSCQGNCGKYMANSSCHCDAACKQFDNCCADYDQQCSVQPPPAKCGDGKCDVAAGESSKSCPNDCGPPPAKACKTKGDCSSNEICCAQADGQVCVAFGQCN